MIDKINQLQPLVEKIKHRKTITLAIGIVLLIVIVIVIIFSSSGQSQKKSQKIASKVNTQTNYFYLGKQLNDISAKLANLQNQLTANKPVINLDAINKQLAKLVNQIKQLSEQSSSLISKEIKTSTAVLEAKLNVIKAELTKLQQEQKKPTYFLPASKLPYQVQAIDNIQGINIISVNYNNTTIPLEDGDYLAGWKLATSDFAKQKAEFVNQQSQHILVNLFLLENKK